MIFENDMLGIFLNFKQIYMTVYYNGHDKYDVKDVQFLDERLYPELEKTLMMR